MSEQLTKTESFFDKSVCCVCTQSIFMKAYLQYWITAVIIIFEIIGGVCFLSYYNNIGLTTTLRTIGYIFHFLSLGLAFLMASYLGRYLSGMQHDRYNQFKNRHKNNSYYDDDYGDECCECLAYDHQYLIPYFLGVIYTVFIFTAFCIIAEKSKNITINTFIIDGMSEIIIIYFASFIGIWYYAVVFKPLIPNFCFAFGIDSEKTYLEMTEERRNEWANNSCFMNFFTKYGFYQQYNDVTRYYIWSSISLVCAFIVSVFVMNCGFAVYYNNRTYHYVIISLSIIFTVISLVLGIIILICEYKDNNKYEGSHITWIIIIVLWLLSSFGAVWAYFPYGGVWSIDSAFVQTSMMRNIFFIVQAVPSFLAILFGVGYLLYLFGKFIGWLFGSCLKNEIEQAQQRIGNSEIKTVQIKVEPLEMPCV